MGNIYIMKAETMEVICKKESSFVPRIDETIIIQNKYVDEISQSNTKIFDPEENIVRMYKVTGISYGVYNGEPNENIAEDTNGLIPMVFVREVDLSDDNLTEIPIQM